MTLDVLHALTRSLTKSEKRYFRLLAGRQAGDKAFVRLFDYLLAYDTLNEALATVLIEQFPGTTLEPARKHLYRMVMQSLRQFEGTKRIDVRLGQLLHESQLLYERGLVQAAQDQAEKARRLAEGHERSLYAVLAARQQTEQWLRLQFDGIDESVLAAQHARIRQQLDQAQNALQHAALYETLLLRYRTLGTSDTPPDVRRLNDLLLEEHQLLNRQKQPSFAQQQQHLHFQSAYFRMIGDDAGSLRIYRELDALFQRHPDLWTEQPLYYVQLLEGILADLRALERHDEMRYFLDQLRRVTTTDAALQQLIDDQAVYYDLLIEADQGRYEQAYAQLRADEPVRLRTKADRRGSVVPLPLHARLQLLMVRVESGSGRLSEALHRLNRLLTMPTRSLPGGLYRQTRLMNILLHARLGHADYVAYDLRSVARKLTQSGPPRPAETGVLTLVQQWLGGRLPADPDGVMATIGSSPADRQLLRDLDLRLWLRAMQDA